MKTKKFRRLVEIRLWLDLFGFSRVGEEEEGTRWGWMVSMDVALNDISVLNAEQAVTDDDDNGIVWRLGGRGWTDASV